MVGDGGVTEDIYVTNAFRECASDGVTRKIRSKVNGQYCASGRRVKHLSKIEGVVDERRGSE